MFRALYDGRGARIPRAKAPEIATASWERVSSHAGSMLVGTLSSHISSHVGRMSSHVGTMSNHKYNKLACWAYKLTHRPDGVQQHNSARSEQTKDYSHISGQAGSTPEGTTNNHIHIDTGVWGLDTPAVSHLYRVYVSRILTPDRETTRRPAVKMGLS